MGNHSWNRRQGTPRQHGSTRIEGAATTAKLVPDNRPGNCGECLMNDAQIVRLPEDGRCPKCGTEYGKAATNG